MEFISKNKMTMAKIDVNSNHVQQMVLRLRQFPSKCNSSYNVEICVCNTSECEFNQSKLSV